MSLSARSHWRRLQDEADEAMESATVTLDVFGTAVTQDVEVPVGRTHPRRMLPVFRSLAETLIKGAVARAETEGKAISCVRGCSACCRQLIPIPPAEAHALEAVVDALPDRDRARVLDRFAEAGRRLEASGLAERLRSRVWDDDEQAYTALGLEYFALGIPCPFLDDESACSIYLDRPVVCREFLVTSPAENCARPAVGAVTAIPLPGQVSRKLSSLDAVGTGRGREGPWTPLVLALEWASTHPEGEPKRTGVELMQDFFAKIPSRAGARRKGTAKKRRKR